MAGEDGEKIRWSESKKAMYPNQIIIASHNSHKIHEMRQILQDFPVQILSLDDLNWEILPAEDGLTYYDNALKKVRNIVNHFGKPAIGEDSGLEVDALGGIPGIHSARYAGEGATDEANNRKLLNALQGVPWDKRTARYRCTIVFLFPTGEIHAWEGICEGLISLEPKGSAGFGYDPVFFLPEYNKTFGELDSEIKNAISHRAKALAGLKKFFQHLPG